MPLSRLRRYLDTNGVKYVVIAHSPAFTAQGIAAQARIPGKEFAKTLVVKLDGELAMAVLPASFDLDSALLKSALQAKVVQLASEHEFKDLFPDCDTGAMPPFGNLYGMRVFADETLSLDKEIVFNACSHRELIRMAWQDFERLVHPRLMRLAKQRVAKAA